MKITGCFINTQANIKIKGKAFDKLINKEVSYGLWSPPLIYSRPFIISNKLYQCNQYLVPAAFQSYCDLQMDNQWLYHDAGLHNLIYGISLRD